MVTYKKKTTKNQKRKYKDNGKEPLLKRVKRIKKKSQKFLYFLGFLALCGIIIVVILFTKKSPTTTAPPTTATPTVAPTVAPTTASPTTVAPTTVAPTTASPTTASPTTATPTTASPITATPTTVAPTTASPTTASPTTASPTTASPTTATPTTATPTTATPTTVAPYTGPICTKEKSKSSTGGCQIESGCPVCTNNKIPYSISPGSQNNCGIPPVTIMQGMPDVPVIGLCGAWDSTIGESGSCCRIPLETSSTQQKSINESCTDLSSSLGNNLQCGSNEGAFKSGPLCCKKGGGDCLDGNDCTCQNKIDTGILGVHTCPPPPSTACPSGQTEVTTSLSVCKTTKLADCLIGSCTLPGKESHCRITGPIPAIWMIPSIPETCEAEPRKEVCASYYNKGECKPITSATR